MIVIGFDPGETTGVCVFEQEGNDAVPVKYANVPFLQLHEWLDSAPKPDVVVIEDYKILSHKAMAHIGSKLETVQAIGIISAYRYKHRAKEVKQPADIKPIAEKFTQVTPPKKHSEGHWVDAFNHAMYWMINEGLARTQLDKEAAGK